MKSRTGLWERIHHSGRLPGRSGPDVLCALCMQIQDSHKANLMLSGPDEIGLDLETVGVYEQSIS